MRSTSSPSYYSYYLAAVVGWLFPLVTWGYSVTGDGCFERESGVVRLTEPTCTLTLTTDTPEQIRLAFENVDPDSVEITSTDLAVITERISTRLETSFTLTDTGTLTIAPWFEVDEDDLWFIALSDNQARGTVETNPIFEDMLPMISAINPVFMTNSGDLIQGSNEEATVRDMFTAVLNTLAEATVPMYSTPGNHDHNSDLGIYESYFGAVDYSYEYGPAQLLALSTSGTTSRGTVTPDQLAWLTEELTDTTKQTIAYFHHPLSVPSWGKSTCCFEGTTERDDLAAVFETGGLDQAISGHSQGYDWRFLTTSDISSLQVGLYQLISGGGGGNIAQPDGDYHFTLIHVTPDEITHQVFELSDTDIVVDDSAADEIIVEYDGTADLPYLRLKFKVANTIPRYLIANEAGDYLPFQQHNFDNYTVLFAATAIATGTSTFTALPANTLHTDISQTVDTTGYITFPTIPTNTSSNTGITVVPNKLTTTISAVTKTDTGYTWIEQPVSRSINTTYTLPNLPARAKVSVYVNDQLYTRGRSDSAGQYSFSYTPNQLVRTVTVVAQTDLTDIITVPTNSGTAHIRTFTTSGENIGNFFSADDRSGNFALQYAYLTDQSELNLLVTDVARQRLFVHAADGTLLARVYVTGEVHSSANRLYVAQQRSIRSYRWSQTKQKFIAVDRWRPAGRLVDWTVVGDDIIALTKLQSRYRLVTKSKAITLPSRLRSVQLVTCQCSTSTTANALVVWQKNKRTVFSTYNNDLIKLNSQTIRQSGDIQQVVTGQVTDQTLDSVLVVVDDVLFIWAMTPSGKLQAITTIAGIDHVAVVNTKVVLTTSNRPVQALVYDDDNLLTSFYPYGETFMGGVTLAVP